MLLAVNELDIVADMKGGHRSAIVSKVSFSVAQGKRLAIVGRSGCGKTMTALSILGLLPENCHASGSVRWDGKELLSLPLRERRGLLGRAQVLIPQSGADFLNPSLTVRRQMGESLARNAVPKDQREAAMTALLARVGFDDPERVLRAYPFQLSGGMAQRVVMSMASAGSPRLVVADEPTKGIDRENTAQFLSNLTVLFPQAAVLLITHDISVAAACDHLLVMREGRVEEYGETQQVLLHPESEYTHGLICDLPHAISHAERGML